MRGIEIFWLCLGIIVFIGILVYLYGYIFEVRMTRLIKYEYHDKTIKKVKETSLKEGLKIIFFSDLHLGKNLHGKQLKKKLDFILKQNADIYLFGGDLIGYRLTDYVKSDEIIDRFNDFLTVPCYKIKGNHEYKKEEHTSQETKDLYFAAMPFKPLVNEKEIIEYKDKKIAIIGLQEGQYHKPEMPKIDEDVDLKIVMIHQGDYFDTFNDVDIVLSGHTHGGQIRIPFLPPIYSPKHGKKYNRGLFIKDNKALIVSKGVGCNMFKFRFLASSDIIELKITF